MHQLKNSVRLSTFWSGRRRNERARERKYVAPSYTVCNCPISRVYLGRSFAFLELRMVENDADVRSTKARPQFRGLSEAEVFLEMEIGDSAAGAEVTRLVAAYYCKFKTALLEQGRAAAPVIMIDVTCPIEKVAVFTLFTFMEKELLARQRGSPN